VKSLTSPSDLRAGNLRVVLDAAWGSDAVTGSELMARTGLTRTTIHEVCEELTALGWLHELDSRRTPEAGGRGRPSRRYAFSARAGGVIGVDAGSHHLRVALADLNGTLLERVDAELAGDDQDPAERRSAVLAAVQRLRTAAAGSVNHVLRIVIGIPAAVDSEGNNPAPSNAFWERMNAGLGPWLSDATHVPTTIENDANLAALAEFELGGVGDLAHQVTILAGLRIGVGIVDGGKIVRGRHGRAGEMRYLELVQGVGTATGVAAIVLALAVEALDRDPARASVLRLTEPHTPSVPEILAAAMAGDDIAREVVANVGGRLARTVATLVSILDPEVVTIAGGISEAAGAIVDVVRHDLPAYLDQPLPEVHASVLGEDVVLLGAIRQGLRLVRRGAPTLGSSVEQVGTAPPR